MQPLAYMPVWGILLGGALTATVLAGRRARDDLRARAGRIDAALSLGFVVRDARLLVLRASASKALVPALDQTRTVGLVTLPGALVGMLLGGASPAAAAAVQLLVLVSLLLVQTTIVATTVELAARGAIDLDPRP